MKYNKEVNHHYLSLARDLNKCAQKQDDSERYFSVEFCKNNNAEYSPIIHISGSSIEMEKLEMVWRTDDGLLGYLHYDYRTSDVKLHGYMTPILLTLDRKDQQAILVFVDKNPAENQASRAIAKRISKLCLRSARNEYYFTSYVTLDNPWDNSLLVTFSFTDLQSMQQILDRLMFEKIKKILQDMEEYGHE